MGICTLAFKIWMSLAQMSLCMVLFWHLKIWIHMGTGTEINSMISERNKSVSGKKISELDL